MKYRLSSKVKGIARVSFANLLSLAVSLITSFLLPYFISVEDYGYWQRLIHTMKTQRQSLEHLKISYC